MVDGLTAMIASAILVHGSNPHLDTTILAILANFHVDAILAISTYIKYISVCCNIVSLSLNLPCGALSFFVTSCEPVHVD